MPTKGKKRDLTYFLLAALVVTIAVCVFLIVHLQSKRDKGESLLNVTLSTEGVTQERLEFEALSLSPGQSREYTVNVSGGMDCPYAISLAFTQTAESTMRDFVNVKVYANGELLADSSLASLFAGETIALSHTFGKDETLGITVRYEMPESVGDEAQGTSASFDLVMTARAA